MKTRLSSIFKLLMAATLAVTTMQPFQVVQANNDVNTNTRAALTNEQLASLTVPVLQSYVADQSNKVWTLDNNKKLGIEVTPENVNNARLKEVVKLFNSELMEKQLVQDPLEMSFIGKANASANDIFIVLDKVNPITDQSNSDEAFKIEISDAGVRITGASENAILYALRTIEQIVIANDGLVYGTIVDYPDVAERRIHVDCGRKYFSKDWFIRQIREMSYFRMNALQMHFSENLGFRIECETDPAIVSDEYLTKQEVREIIAEAKKYGVKVIPSIDSPGHVDQILRAHPEYGQISNNGNHYASGLDITNPEAIQYMYSIYDEYMELFEGCTDFHLGGDEYMEFDRPPFTSEYRDVLDAYAKETFGQEYSWKDTVANYINELAERVHNKGFKPRIWNDGIYYGNNRNPQKIEMHKYIGIDFWSQMGWNRDIAKLDQFVKHGHEDIYNVNCTYFYYVLRNSMPSDGREQHSFDHLNADQLIYNDWTPGKFESNTLPDDHPSIKGASMAIWCDSPSLCTEDVVTSDIANEMRAFASKTWNVRSNEVKAFDQFKTDYAKLGHVAGFEKQSVLPDSGDIQQSVEIGKLTIKYVDQDGKTIKADDETFGFIGDAYDVKPATLYGYRPVDASSKTGVYEKESVITFVYELYCDKTALKAELDNKLVKENYIESTFETYQEALTAAQAAYESASSTQQEVDDALALLQREKAKPVKLGYFELYAETTYQLNRNAYVSGYDAYAAAIDEGKALLADASTTQEDVDGQVAKIQATKKALTKRPISRPKVQAAKAAYGGNVAENMVDGNTSTKYWSDGSQTEGTAIVFTFPKTVNMNGIHIIYPSNATTAGDNIKGADIQISTDGDVWKTVGSISATELDKDFTFESQPVLYARIKHTVGHNNWLQIAEVVFDVQVEEVDPAFVSLVDNVRGTSLEGKDYALANRFVQAFLEAQRLLAEGETDVASAKAELLDAYNKVIDKKDITVQTYSISLDGTITMNFYVSLAPTVLEDTTAYAKFVREDNTEVKLSVADILQCPKTTYKGEDVYRVSVPMSARQICDEIVPSIHYTNAETQEVVDKTYDPQTIQAYAQYILDHPSTYQKENKVIKAMLNYGTRAQLYFNYNTDRLANSILSVEDREVNVANSQFNQYRAYKAGSLTGLDYIGTSVVLESDTGISHYFTLAADASLDDYTFTMNGEVVKPVVTKNTVRVDVKNIYAKNLGKDFVLTINHGDETMEIHYSPLAYGKIVLSNAYPKTLKDVVRAMYVYNEEAIKYAK